MGLIKKMLGDFGMLLGIVPVREVDMNKVYAEYMGKEKGIYFLPSESLRRDY